MRRLLIGSVLLLVLIGCSPAYLIRAAYEESKILLARRNINSVLEDLGETAPEQELRNKLELVLAARAFGEKIGLKPGHSFTKYSEVDREELVWVVLGSKPEAFELHTWWYPFVGTVPYKGFFEKEDALKEAQALEQKGFETWVRSSETFSTLGWFNDPVLSTTLKNRPSQIANTVLHESFHNTVWIADHVDFNESMANFVGFQGAIDYFTFAVQQCAEDKTCLESQRKNLDQAVRENQFEIELSLMIEKLFEQLNALYQGEIPREAKIAKRQEVFTEYVAPFRTKYPQMKVLQSVNNAEIMQLKLYLTKFSMFHQLFEHQNHDWNAFLRTAREIADKCPEDPFHSIEELAR